MDQEQKPRERSFIRELVPDWRPTREQVIWGARIVLVLVVLLGILTLIGLPFGITLWEWVKLLIVPAVIAGGGIWFNQQQRERELKIEEQRAQDEALQGYLDVLAELLVEKHVEQENRQVVRLSLEEGVLQVVQARAEALVRRLDPNRRWSLAVFLTVVGLLDRREPLVNLTGFDLRGVDGRGAPLRRMALQGVDLSRADLTTADLREADLLHANPTAATLIGTSLSGARLAGANLTGADLSGADLTNVLLSDAVLSGADLSDVVLTNADLEGAIGITNEELAQQARSLEGSLMPNRQPYEDWLKSKDRGEDGENSGPS